jgi:pSer/pThr/pTyr-binding forkhead associated (FHA) protein
MTSAGIPMLFLPTQAPVQLPVDGTVLIGRGSDADLRLTDADTSRRHAKIVCGPLGCVIHDLHSTNGTWVNGNRVDQHLLRAGDRITIGDHVIAFCQVRTVIDGSAGDSAPTVFRDGPPPSWTREAFRGDLAEIPPYAVIQILELGQKTGELTVEGDTTGGRIWLRRGRPVHAETKTQAGFDAALALVLLERGTFAFEPTLDGPEATIQATVTQLILEASRVQDEQRHAESQS